MRLPRVVLILFPLLFCVSALAQLGGNPRFTNLQIHVQARFASGATAPRGAAVTVEAENGGLAAQGQTDSQGKANFSIQKAGFYVVEMRYPGYQVVPSSERVDLNTANSAYVNFELRPIPGVKAVPPGGPAAEVTANADAMKEYQKGEKLLLKEQKPDDSVDHFRKAIKLDGRFQPAYVMLGMAYLAQQKPADAQLVLEKAIQLNPQSGAAHLELGAALNQQKRFAEAEKELALGLQINPEAPEGHYEIARSYWAMGKVAESESHALQAAKMRPDMAGPHVLLGNVALRKGDPQSAVKEFKEYLRLEPDGPMAKPVRDLVAKIEKGKK